MQGSVNGKAGAFGIQHKHILLGLRAGDRSETSCGAGEREEGVQGSENCGKLSPSSQKRTAM